MAFTERYVTTTGAGAHDGTSEADAWSFAEMIAATPAAGTRVNTKAGTYSEGTTTLPANGTVAAPIVIRGYNSTIGDLDNQGRNADGTLNTTNFPAFTLTGIWTPSPYCNLQNLNCSGALSSGLISSSASDNYNIISCKVVNTQNNAAARCVVFDNTCTAINCDFSCTGAAHASVLDGDANISIVGCRFFTTSSSACVTIESNNFIAYNGFSGNSSSVGLSILNAQAIPLILIGNTFYGIGTAVTLPNSATNAAFVLIAINNIVSNCSKWIDNLYSATGNITSIELNNLLYTVTTARTGVEAVIVGELSSDPLFVNAGAGNFRLDTGSPALGVGLTPYMDIGAYQKEATAGGAGGGPIVGPGAIVGARGF